MRKPASCQPAARALFVVTGYKLKISRIKYLYIHRSAWCLLARREVSRRLIFIVCCILSFSIDIVGGVGAGEGGGGRDNYFCSICRLDFCVTA
ncbi:hypothetical protein KS4_27780 [Poriferisphaera corsica]|uniref:Uncharacterized protein n=1 Tax=Poriferisphaera corsica TaxID=2528020 RepID=A0A517YWU9_9BACT|nr:hypothetical protein KS4_27780 [Poriferisphaera corsica]